MAQDNREVTTCDECGRLILANVGIELCPGCFARQLDAYKRIEKVLAETPDISASELSRQAEVSTSVIRRLARKKRIKLREEDEAVRCTRCGELMDEVGKFCATCRAELILQAKEAAATLKEKLRGKADVRGRSHGVVRALTRKRSLFRPVDYGTKGKYSP